MTSQNNVSLIKKSSGPALSASTACMHTAISLLVPLYFMHHYSLEGYGKQSTNCISFILFVAFVQFENKATTFYPVKMTHMFHIFKPKSKL